jgi:hypothetical protein
MRYKWRITAATSPEGSAGESARNVLIPVGTYAGSRGLAGRLADFPWAHQAVAIGRIGSAAHSNNEPSYTAMFVTPNRVWIGPV